jgi:hypothetical protein
VLKTENRGKIDGQELAPRNDVSKCISPKKITYKRGFKIVGLEQSIIGLLRRNQPRNTCLDLVSREINNTAYRSLEQGARDPFAMRLLLKPRLYSRNQTFPGYAADKFML